MNAFFRWLRGPVADPNPPTHAYRVNAARAGIWSLDYEGVDEAIARKTAAWHVAHGNPVTLTIDGASE